MACTRKARTLWYGSISLRNLLQYLHSCNLSITYLLIYSKHLYLHLFSWKFSRALWKLEKLIMLVALTISEYWRSKSRYRHVCLSIYLCIYLSFFLSFFYLLSIYLSVYLSTLFLSNNLSITFYFCLCLFIYLSISLSI